MISLFIITLCCLIFFITIFSRSLFQFSFSFSLSPSLPPCLSHFVRLTVFLGRSLFVCFPHLSLLISINVLLSVYLPCYHYQFPLRVRPPLLPSMQIFTSAKASVSHTSVAFTAHYNARRSHTLIYSFLEKKEFLKVIKIKAGIKGDRDYKIKFKIRSHYKVNFNLMCNNCTKTVKALCSYDAIPEHNSNVLIMRQIVFFFFPLCLKRFKIHRTLASSIWLNKEVETSTQATVP